MISSRASPRLLALVVAPLAWFGSWTPAPATAEPLGFDAPAVALGDVCAHDGSIAASWQVAASTAAQPAPENWPVANSLFYGAGSAPSTTYESGAAHIYDRLCAQRAHAHGVHRGLEASTQVVRTRASQVPRRLSTTGTSTTPLARSVATNTALVTVDDLTGSTLSNYNRFVKNLPAAAETPTIRNLADGSIEFSAKVPATNIPGSYATYTKIVGPDGVTTSFIKTTIAPDGSVVSVKVKFP